MARMATNDTLSSGFAIHRDETEVHVQHVEDAFDALSVEHNRHENLVVDALLEEKAQYDEMAADDDLRNLYYMSAGMKTERLEITSYEGMTVTAKIAELGDAVTDPLEENPDEEEKTFRKLEGRSTGSELKALWNKLTS